MSDAAATTQHATISATLASGFRLLRFPAALEEAYRGVHAARALDVVRAMLPWVTLLYAAATLVMFGGAVNTAFDAWLENALWPVAGALGWLWLARLTPLLARDVHLHIALVLGVSLVATVRAIFVIGDQPGVVYVTYQVIYLLFIAFTVAQLRLQQALTVVAISGTVLVVAALAENLPADWLAFGQYYVATTLISAVIGYMMEHRERSEWLKSELAAIEKQEMLELKQRTDAESARQQLLGNYLEHVGGNLTATEIAGRTLRFLIDHAGAQVGAVYLVEGDRVRRAASWALGGELQSADELGRGETLVGQAAENGRRLRLRHLPHDYHRISTATGSGTPAELLVEPVQHNGRVLSVIELGALQHLDDHQIELVDRIGRAMANTLVAANARDALARANMADFAI